MPSARLKRASASKTKAKKGRAKPSPSSRSKSPSSRKNQPILRRLSPKEGIQVIGAKEHNLKNINVFIPRDKITLITGLSGSGKSSLAFDTLYGEGQRRYLESLSLYARYFIDQMKKPKVDFIHGLSPSIAISQKTISFNPRSTLGTLTETYDFLRLLYAKTGDAICPKHKEPLKAQTAEEIAEEIARAPKTEPLLILSPLARGKKGEFSKDLERCLSLGFDKARIDGQWAHIGKTGRLEKRKDHYIDVLIDRLVWAKGFQDRIAQAVDKALSLSHSFVKIENKKGFSKNYSLNFSCPLCDYSFLDLEPKLFSFNSPKGACPSCNGSGMAKSEEIFSEEDLEGETAELCPECGGGRLRQEALLVKIKGLNINQLSSMAVQQLKKFIKQLSFSGARGEIADRIKKPLLERLSFLQDLNLGYLSLGRSLSSLSGGEAQRANLASQLSSPVIGALYALDEPSIGLHAKDHSLILKAAKKIKDRGNTVIIVEHDEESIRQADKIIDLGPGAGKEGGFVAAEGTLEEIQKSKKSLTGAYLSKRKSIPLYESRYSPQQPRLRLEGLRANNLKNIDVDIPLSCLVGVSGVSGSGKSSLVTDTVYPLLAKAIYKSQKPVGAFSKASGFESLKRAALISQKPIGRTPRSNPATYIGLFQMIRHLFSFLPESRMRGFAPGAFSFNIPGGRCESCKGAGAIKLEMRFLPDVFTVCGVCRGKRYNPEILSVQYKGKSVYDILSMTVDTAEGFFKNHPHIRERLNFLKEAGLGYITLGQSSLTLSGGEAQRVKLSKELAKRAGASGFYILDEPTTGLHFQDVERLMKILRRLSGRGNTVVVIEHHLDILKSCDYLIDLGPKGGKEGGRVMASGTPAQVAKNPKSPTGRYLKPYFK